MDRPELSSNVLTGETIEPIPLGSTASKSLGDVLPETFIGLEVLALPSSMQAERRVSCSASCTLLHTRDLLLGSES